MRYAPPRDRLRDLRDLVRPWHEGLLPEVLDWFEDEARGAERREVWVLEGDEPRIEELFRRGYARDEGPFFIRLARTLEDLATAVCLGGLWALKQAGADTAIVHARGDSAYPAPLKLYTTLGFEPVGRMHRYVGALGRLSAPTDG